MQLLGELSEPSNRLAGRRDWYSLELRHQAMTTGRALGLIVLIAIASLIPSGAVPHDRAHALAACICALAANLALWAAPRRFPRLLRIGVDVSLLVDAALTVALAAASGGSGSPALWLFPLTTLFATLTYSARTGLKAALLAIIGVLALQAMDGAISPFTADNGWRLALFALMVGAAAGASAVNEAELRRRADRIEALAVAAAGFVAANDLEALDAIALEGAARLLPEWTVDIVTDGDGEHDAERAYRAGSRLWLEIAVPALQTGQPDTLSRRPMVLRAWRPHRWTVRRVQLRGQQLAALRALVTSFQGALLRAELLARLEHLSSTDPLTGLGNRRSFDEELETELTRSARAGETVSLLLIDVDHFKSVNDLHGHQTGDEVLREIAAVLAGSLRGADRGFRIGGEEFAAILPSTPGTRAVGVADRLRRAIAGHRIGDLNVTVSIGIGCSDGHDAASDIIAAADARLYLAKDRGRNRVEAAQQQVAHSLR